MAGPDSSDRLLLALGVGLLKSLAFCSGVLPPAQTARLGRFIGRLASHVSKREMRIALAQLKMASRTAKELRADPLLVRGVFEHIGESVAELLMIEQMLRSTEGDPLPRFEHIRATGEDLCARYIKERKAAVALSGHIGNFELLAAYHTKCGIPVTVIGREPNYSSVSDWLDALRNSYGVENLFRKGRGAASGFIRALKNERTIAVLIDQDTNLDNGYSPFFGVTAASPIAPIELSVRYGLRMFTSFIVRESPLRHYVISEEVVYDPKDPGAVAGILALYNERLEALVRRYPSQWVWFHRRWRRREEIDYRAQPEKLLSTEDYIAWLDALT